MTDNELRLLFEAVRWAASSYNEQPWRCIVATKANTAEFERLLSCLVEGNQAWAKAAPVLAIGCTSLNLALNNKPNAAAAHDLGSASASITLETTARGLFVHQMIGIVPDKVRELYRVPEGVQPLTWRSVIRPTGIRCRKSAGSVTSRPEPGSLWLSLCSAASGGRPQVWSGKDVSMR